MGWTSTGDPYANVGDAGLSFDSEEAARAFAEKHGWDYVVRFLYHPFPIRCIYLLKNYLCFVWLEMLLNPIICQDFLVYSCKLTFLLSF